MSRILIDGWSIVYEPSSPEALQIWALLAWVPAQIEVLLALPGERPAWLPESILSVHQKAENTSWGRLKWEQRYLPTLGVAAQIRSLHVVGEAAPLLGNLLCTSSPAWYTIEHETRRRSMTARLRRATGLGGLNRAQAILWPVDLPFTDSRTHLPCPPFVHPDFLVKAKPSSWVQLTALDLPETFVLYHGPGDESSLRRLLTAWSWAAGPIGGYYPLLLLGLDALTRDRAIGLINEYDLTDSVHCLSDLPTSLLPALYQHCSALFHPADIVPWGDAVLHAMACGVPIAAAALPGVSARVGPAAFLADPADSRALGAAIITLIVEQGMAERLSLGARQRFSNHNITASQEALAQIWKT